MNDTIQNPKEELALKLLHYFITEQNYQPIVLHGGNQNEVWLENLEAPYKIVRIMNGYIHNKEQLEFDLYKTEDILSKIKKKTFSYKMTMLSFMLDMNENVNPDDTNHIQFIKINEEQDLEKYENIHHFFPNIQEKIKFKEDGIELIMKVTNDINHKNKLQSEEAASIFKSNRPYVTYVLIGMNVLLYILMYFLGSGSEDENTLIRFGALVSDLVKNHEVYRLITSMFLHAGIFHLLFNMQALYILGPQIENFFGKGKYLFIYFFSGLVGNLLSILFIPHTISVGASGAIFGLLGALAYFGYHHRVYLGNVLKTQIIPIIILNVAIGFLIPNINIIAHLGGLLAGILATYTVGMKKQRNSFERVNGFIVSSILILFLTYLFFSR